VVVYVVVDLDDLDVNGDGDVNAEDPDARGAPARDHVAR
jgi:hypothetical protein